MANNSTKKTIIVLMIIIISCCLGLFFIMKFEKTSNLLNNSNNISNKTDKNTEINTNVTSVQTVNRNYEYIEDTDVFEPKTAFGWGNPVITNYAWESGMYYEAYGDVDSIKAFNEYKEYLTNKGYKLIKEEKNNNATMYTYSKGELNVILGIQKNKFEITLSK